MEKEYNNNNNKGIFEPKTMTLVKTPWGDEYTEKERKEFVKKEWLFHVTPNYLHFKPNNRINK